ncbi:MAG: methyltransferase domain-containing protein [Acidobacteriota bacterium]
MRIGRGDLGVMVLNWVSRHGEVAYPEATAYAGKSKLEVLIGPGVWDEVRGKTVLDFGSGTGQEAVEAAERGALKVIGLELREKWLEMAKAHAEARGMSEKCLFASEYHGEVDTIISLDSFEHFDDPADILRRMAALLKPGGKVLVSFGPTWYHPLGGHFFSVFPWSHLLFSERSQLKWRAIYKGGDYRTFMEVGLNKMTIRRFRRLVDESPFKFASFEAVPIRRLARVHNLLTREFTSAIVRCVLVKR